MGTTHRSRLHLLVVLLLVSCGGRGLNLRDPGTGGAGGTTAGGSTGGSSTGGTAGDGGGSTGGSSTGGTAGNGPESCSLLDGTDLAKTYQECVAAGGKVTPAGDGYAAFCTLRFNGGTTGYGQCDDVGGYWVTWDCFCPGNFSGGYACFLFYPENACPVFSPPDGRLPIPPCVCSGTGGTQSTGGSASSGGSGGRGGSGGSGGSGGRATGGTVTTGGSSAAGGATASGGRVGTGGGSGTGGVPATGGAPGTGGTARDASADASVDASVDASIPSGCGCTLVNDVWELSWDCFCAVRECGDTLSNYQADGGSEGVFWALEEYAGCGLAVVVQTSPQKDVMRFFDLTTGSFVGYSETVNGGISCPFGVDAASLVFWLRAGQTVPAGCARTRCIHGTGKTGYCP